MNGGLRSPRGRRGRLETRKSHSTLHYVAPLKIISNPLPMLAWGDLRHTHEGVIRGYRGRCDLRNLVAEFCLRFPESIRILGMPDHAQ